MNDVTLPTRAQNEFKEVEISYSEDLVFKKLISYQLKPQYLYTALRVDLTALTQAKTQANARAPMQQNTCLLALHDTLSTWQASHNLQTFTQQINQLVFAWLNASQEGASTETIINLLKCLQLNPRFSLSQTPKLHCFLLDLLAETTQKFQQLQVDYARHFDANTLLPNASQISVVLKEVIANASHQHAVCLMSMHFQLAKNNPFFSHAITAGLAKAITSVLQKNLTIEHQLYFDDDLEFDLLIPRLSNDIQLNLVVAKLQRAFEQLIFVGNQSVLVTPFIGCAFYHKSSQEIDHIQENAKLALENALFNQAPLVIYSETLKEHLSAQNDLENKVIEAFNSDDLTLFFQPLVRLKDNACAGAELLLRWSEHSNQHTNPALTVEILNKVGKGKLFTRWLINSACRYLAEIKHDHQLDIYLTINLRAEDLYDIELPHLLSQAIALWRIEARNIVLEITENGILKLDETTNSVINQLAEGGFRLALDDFGTGFSSLSRLRTMPIHLIKIDQSFVRNIAQSKDDLEIVKSIAMLANSLNKELVAEGVESEDCLKLIKKMKIHKCQGYYFSKALPFEEFVTWAKQHKSSAK